MSIRLATAVAFFLASLTTSFSDAFSLSTGGVASDWRPVDLSFRPLNITNSGSSLWTCGTDEGIAVSSDSGSHCQIKHRTTDSNLLLNIKFESDKFGYAAGTGGLLLTTEDGGQTWISHLAGSATILQVSFADKEHG